MSEAQRLRHAIDSGRTGEKVRAPDFAAAPLGTDDEAAGYPPQHDGSRAKAAGDRLSATLYEPASEEDNRAPATAPPSWRTWGFIALGLLALGIAAAGLAA